MQRAIYVRGGPLDGKVVTIHGDLEPGPESELIDGAARPTTTVRLNRATGKVFRLDDGLMIQVFDCSETAIDAEADYIDPPQAYTDV
jgi:hypothetical protein